jgi:hypothetical protein
MTGPEMIHEFKLGLDKIDSFSVPNLLDSEAYSILNNAYEQVITQRLYGNNTRREAVEETQKRIDDLRNLTHNYSYDLSTISNTDANKPNGIFVPLPTDYRHAIQEEIKVTYIECNTSVTNRQRVVPRTHDEYDNIVDDPFNQPYSDEIIRLPYNSNQFELIGDSLTTLLTYYLRYIKQPLPISPTQSCELALHTHREIVAIAVAKTLEGIESPRYPSNTQELNKTE